MPFNEEELGDIILKTDNNILRSKGLYLCKNKLKQVRLGGRYGVADIICWEKIINKKCCLSASPDVCGICHNKKCKRVNYIHIQVVELKTNCININTFLQAIRYAKAVKEFFEDRFFHYKLKLEIILIGHDFNTTEFSFIKDIISMSDIWDADINYFFEYNAYTYHVDIDGLKFKSLE